MTDLRSRVTIGAGVAFRDLGREAVLLDATSGSYFGLDEVGTRIWRLLAAGETLPAIVAALAGEYDVDEERLAADLQRLVDELAASGLVVVEPA